MQFTEFIYKYITFTEKKTNTCILCTYVHAADAGSQNSLLDQKLIIKIVDS